MKRNIILYGCLLVLLSAAQCRKEKDTAAINNNSPVINNDSAKTYMALGDSYTIGQSVSASERFPAQTVALLRASGINIKDPQYIAVTGWTSNDLSNAIGNPQLSFNVVSLLIGVNDQYQTHDTTGYRQRFRDIILKATKLAGNNSNNVFVLSIPDYSVTPYAANYDTAFIRKQIELFNNINRQVSIEQSCHYLDITPSTREALTDPTLIAPDGLHPSGKEYAKWAGWLAPMMSTVLH